MPVEFFIQTPVMLFDGRTLSFQLMNNRFSAFVEFHLVDFCICRFEIVDERKIVVNIGNHHALYREQIVCRYNIFAA